MQTYAHSYGAMSYSKVRVISIEYKNKQNPMGFLTEPNL